MTSDDRLAPVTPLFGAPSADAAAVARERQAAADDALRSAVSRHPAGTGRGGRRGKASSSAEPASPSRAPANGSAAETGAVAVTGSAAETGSSTAEGDTTDGWSAGAAGADEDGGRSPLRALPTYAAFAATTERGEALTPDSENEPSAFVREATDTRSPAERRTDARIAARKKAAAAAGTAPGTSASPTSARTRSAAATGPRAVDGEGARDDETSEAAPETLEAAAQRAENISMHALSRRGVSSLEMVRILTSRDLPTEVVAAEVERLERVGLLDDTELAENLVRSKQERKGLGKGAITAELRQRGVAQEAIEAAVAEIDDDDEQARCDEWAEKRVGQLRGLDHATAERRLNGYLMRRGYRSEVIRRAIEKALPKGGSGGGVRFR